MRRNRTLLMLIVVTAAVEVLGFSFATVLPELATDRLGVGAEGLGIMHAVRAAGGFAAGIALAGTLSFRRRGLAYLVVIYAFGLALIGLGFAPSYASILLAVLAVAALASASDVLTQSMMQLSVPDRLRGRAMGAWVFAIGSAPVGHPDVEKINVMGGSLSIGHPFGATGGRLTVTILNEMARRDVQFGLITVCAAGGMGFAMVVERR